MAGGELPNDARVREIAAVDVLASNSLSTPDRVALVDRGRIELESGTYEFPAHSITALSFDLD